MTRSYYLVSTTDTDTYYFFDDECSGMMVKDNNTGVISSNYETIPIESVVKDTDGAEEIAQSVYMDIALTMCQGAKIHPVRAPGWH